MKKIFAITLIGFALYSCTDTKEQEKALFKEVITLHDDIMEREHILVDDITILDSMQKTDLPQAVKDSAALLNKQLHTADEAMNEWMHQFEPDYSNKPHDEAMTYLNSQKAAILKVDSLTKNALSQSGKFISTHKK